MDFHDTYDDETMSLLAALDDFLDSEIPPVYKTHESKGVFPITPIVNMGPLGFFGLTVPEQFGGSGKGALLSSLFARNMAYAWGALHLLWTANSSLAAFPIVYAGNQRQKELYLSRLAFGELLGCYALTEPNAGSDVASMKTRAVKQDGHFVLNGTKTFITNAQNATLAVVFAKTGEGKHDISAFILESKELGLKIPGITVNRIPKHVLRSSDFCEIVFDNVIVPEEALLGRVNEGFKIAMATLDRGRINIAAQAVGLAARVFDDSLDCVRLREQFGKKVWDNQAVQFDFADAYARLQVAWAFTEYVSRIADSGDPFSELASCAKLFVTNECKDVALKIAEYAGGMLVTKEFELFERMIDLVPVTIYEGASNIQRLVIARGLDRGHKALITLKYKDSVTAQAVMRAAQIFQTALSAVRETGSMSEGKKMWDNQAVQFDFADIYAELLALMSATEKASQLLDADKKLTSFVSIIQAFVLKRAQNLNIKIHDATSAYRLALSQGINLEFTNK